VAVAVADKSDLATVPRPARVAAAREDARTRSADAPDDGAAAGLRVGSREQQQAGVGGEARVEREAGSGPSVALRCPSPSIASSLQCEDAALQVVKRTRPSRVHPGATSWQNTRTASPVTRVRYINDTGARMIVTPCAAATRCVIDAGASVVRKPPRTVMCGVSSMHAHASQRAGCIRNTGEAAVSLSSARYGGFC